MIWVGGNITAYWSAVRLLTFKQTKGHREVNEMEVKLAEIVQSNYCYFDLYSGCVKGLELPDDAVCGKCIAEAHAAIVRNNDNE